MISDPSVPEHILELVRERGIAYSDEEYEEGINAVTSPILDAKMQPLAALAVAGSAYRLPVKQLLEIGSKLAETAKRISAEYKLANLNR